jgi:multicomponent Na+:H+ antiporter subunit F
MIAQAAGPVSLVVEIMLVVLSVAILLAFYRLAVGPSLPDRVIALDLIATLIVGIVGLYAVLHSDAVFLRVAMIVALINFLGTVGFARYLEK